MDCRDVEAYSLWLNNDNSKVTKKNGLNIIGRRILLKESSYACSECDFDTTHPVDGNPVLQVDHIDGNSMNNNLSNLRVLCPNCHAKTETFGALNAGQGRAALRRLHNG